MKNLILVLMVTVLTACGGFPVTRGSADREALKRCIALLEGGEPLVLFPEGERKSGPVVQPLFDGAAYIAEAVPEHLPTKQAIFHDLDRVASPDTIFASNTSGFDPAALAEGLTHPERVVVAHYFGPAYLIPLVEVVRSVHTDVKRAEQVGAIMASLGKRPVQVKKDVIGFLGNRIQGALMVVHGENDRQVPLWHAEKTYESAVNCPDRTLKVCRLADGAAEGPGD